MVTKFFDCPKCGSKQSAYQSSTYPESIVHKCDGKILNEVALYKNGKILGVNNQVISNLKDQFFTGNFLIRKITNVDELVKLGAQLRNGASMKSDADRYIKTGSVYVVESKNIRNLLYMILIENNTIPAIQYFSGKDISEVPKTDGEEILRALVKEKIISRNPFPHKYYI